MAVTGPAKAETLPSAETLRSQYQRVWPVVRPVRSHGSAVGSLPSLVAVVRLALLASNTCSRTASAGNPPYRRTPPAMPVAAGPEAAAGTSASRQPDTAPLRACARTRKAVGSAVGMATAVAPKPPA